ncbi:winged helix-turn-helix transcriptional regulator [Sphingomonas aracearum]|uniref:Transcriptional regulator n=1 Tax=Sphingomonas aracearum TaxID=2283317 RepID=A0A369VXI9_9SPHN|nr:helix-turn-helix domain-containing protein [Sphingomonas aracearum]RDE05870.1 transcriptional regulator [Sphingomonas aracearum]
MKLDKVSSNPKRWYDDACGTALAMELVGERWSLLIVRELMFGARRFGEIKAGLSGISANVLTQRLDGLERAGILSKRRLPSPANVQVYELTEWGYQSETAIQELGRWAVRSPAHDPSLPLSPASLMMSFRTMIDRHAAAERPMTVSLEVTGEPFVARVDARGIAVERGIVSAADLRLTGATTAFAAVIYGGAPAEGLLTVDGDKALFDRFRTLFPLPAKIATP